MALIVHAVWYRQYKKMVAEWYKRCEHINAHWYDLCMELIDEGADRIKGSKRLLKGKDEPQNGYVLSKDSDAYKFNKRMEVEEEWLKEQSGKE